MPKAVRLTATIGVFPRIYQFLTRNPNRVALYVTALGDILAALLVIFSDLHVEQVATVITTVAALNAKVLVWVKGWQKQEAAEHQALLMRHDLDLRAEQAAAASAPRPTSVRLPR